MWDLPAILYVKAMEERKTIFGIEERTLEKAQSVLNDAQYQGNPLLTEFAALLKCYQHIYGQFRRLIKISDGQQFQLKRAQEQIEAQKQQLEQQNQKLLETARLREDVERISRHDLKSPLNTIISIPTLLMDNPQLDKNERDYLYMIEEVGRQMLHMINFSLDVVKMERGMYQFQPVPVNIVRILQKIAAETQPLRKGKELAFAMFLAGQPVKPEDRLLVAGEKLLCYSMLVNLVKNAIEASPIGACVTVTLETDDTSVLIRIHNQGAVLAAIRDRFFEKYVTSGKPGGTGLGAYSAKLSAETQQGQIAMTTTEEHGTTITIRLPRGDTVYQAVDAYYLPPDVLDSLPEEFLAKFQQAVIRLDYETLLKLVASIHHAYPAFAQAVTKVVQDYRFDVLETFLQQKVSCALP